MSSEKIKKTLSLDSETITILETYGELTSGSKNISGAVRSMTREYRKFHKDELKNLNKREF